MCRPPAKLPGILAIAAVCLFCAAERSHAQWVRVCRPVACSGPVCAPVFQPATVAYAPTTACYSGWSTTPVTTYFPSATYSMPSACPVQQCRQVTTCRAPYRSNWTACSETQVPSIQQPRAATPPPALRVGASGDRVLVNIVEVGGALHRAFSTGEVERYEGGTWIPLQ